NPVPLLNGHHESGEVRADSWCDELHDRDGKPENSQGHESTGPPSHAKDILHACTIGSRIHRFRWLGETGRAGWFDWVLAATLRDRRRRAETVSIQAGPRSHDAAGGSESLAGGACALGEVGWTFWRRRSVQRH